MYSTVKTFSDTFIDLLGPLELIMNTSEGKGMWGSGGVAPFINFNIHTLNILPQEKVPPLAIH
jgi:hypothetical protein